MGDNFAMIPASTERPVAAESDHPQLHQPSENSPPFKEGGVVALMHRLYCDDRKLQVGLLVSMVLIYGVLLGISWGMAERDSLRLTFNSMLDHLLHGKFDVDPEIVGFEGYPYNGKVYAYWGIFPALLRLPLWIFGRLFTDVTVWSCLAAVCVAGMTKVRVVLMLRRHRVRNSSADWAIVLMLAYIVFGPSEIGYLRISIYQEAVFWASSFATLLVYFAVRGLIRNQFDTGTLSAMALFAGLAIMTRASTGVGLVLVVVLLLVVLAMEAPANEAVRAGRIKKVCRNVFKPRILAPISILTLTVGITGAVNYARWGSPLTFVRYSNFCDHCSGDLTHVLLNALFNIVRIPFSLIYYFFPILVLRGADGQLLMHNIQARYFDSIELPPSSFFISDIFALCFIALLVVAMWRRRPTDWVFRGRAGAIAAGLFVPCLLMLTFVDLTYRFRMEFYPEIDFLALLGLYCTVTDEAILRTFLQLSKWITGALAVSILSGFGGLVLYDFSYHGPWQQYLNEGIGHYYGQVFLRFGQIVLRHHFVR